MVFGKIGHHRIDGFGRYEVLEQQLIADIRLCAGYGNYTVESKIQNVAFDFRHGSTGADEELVTVGLGPRTRRFCRLRHNMILISQRAVDINEYEFATSHVAFRHMSTSPSQLTLTAPSRGGEEKNKTCRKRKSTADTSPSRLGRRLPLAETKTASHGVGGPAAVSVLDFDGHAEQVGETLVG